MPPSHSRNLFPSPRKRTIIKSDCSGNGGLVLAKSQMSTQLHTQSPPQWDMGTKPGRLPSSNVVGQLTVVGQISLLTIKIDFSNKEWRQTLKQSLKTQCQSFTPDSSTLPLTSTGRNMGGGELEHSIFSLPLLLFHTFFLSSWSPWGKNSVLVWALHRLQGMPAPVPRAPPPLPPPLTLVFTL